MIRMLSSYVMLSVLTCDVIGFLNHIAYYNDPVPVLLSNQIHQLRSAPPSCPGLLAPFLHYQACPGIFFMFTGLQPGAACLKLWHAVQLLGLHLCCTAAATSESAQQVLQEWVCGIVDAWIAVHARTAIMMFKIIWELTPLDILGYLGISWDITGYQKI